MKKVICLAFLLLTACNEQLAPVMTMPAPPKILMIPPLELHTIKGK